MKPLDYVKKYKLDVNDNFNHSEFVEDLKEDFTALLEVGKGFERLKGFENAVGAIRMKWDGINNKTRGQLPDKLWNYFYATVIAKSREKLFPEQMKARAEERERRQRMYEERKRFKDWDSSFFDWFSYLFGEAQRMMNTTPTQELSLLGLNESATEEDVKSAYRKLSLTHHPDKGGKQSVFVEITSAKNKCLKWLKNK